MRKSDSFSIADIETALRTTLTEISLLQTQETEQKSSRRDVVEKDKKRTSDAKSNHPEDKVFIRKGDKKPFDQRGIIVRKVGTYTYVVDVRGYERTYNQRNLKPRYEQQEHCFDEANEAYDQATIGVQEEPDQTTREDNFTLDENQTDEESIRSDSGNATQASSRRSKRKTVPIDRYGVKPY